MKRKQCLRKGLLGLAGVAGASALVKGAKETVQADDQVGFNHLPNKEERTMKTVLHRADTRGHANHGWLDTYHSFSFANYYNPERMNFGVLRVLNDDSVAPGRGFGRHPHDNMEIISIPLEGDLEHKDSIGNVAVIQQGDVQVMSAGTGVFHSEFNRNADQDVRFLQIWIYPKERNVEPRYDQVSIRDVEEKNTFYQVLSPDPEDAGVWVNQDAWFHLGDFDAGAGDTYQIKKEGNGAYFFVLEGTVTVGEQELSRRDGYGLWDAEQVAVTASSDAKILVIEVPMGQ